MSDINVQGVRATASLDAGPLQRGVAAAQQALTTLEPVVARQWWGLQNLSRAFGAVGAAVTAGFGLAVREASIWEDAMIGVQRTTGASVSELANIEKGLRDVARTTPIAAATLANLAEQAGALGVQNSDIPEFTRIMANLIASTNLTEASVEDLGRTMNVLKVPVENFERFASTLVEVGRSTASTEADIINMSRRLAPMAIGAGFTADEVLALSAAVSSLGVRAEAGASALIRTFGDINVAVGRNGEELENWADVANLSGEEFAKIWRNDASKALEKVIVGLGKYGDDAVGLSAELDHLDQANVRNIITLGALAGGIGDVENEQTSLIAINKLAENAWRENEAMASVAERRMNSLSAQLMILRNMVSEAANTVGQAMLPVFRVAVGVLQDFAYGFEQMPGPIKFVMASLVAVLGIVSLLAAGILALIGPMVLMYQTWRTMRGVFLEGKTAADAASNGVGGLTRVLASQIGVATGATGALTGYNAAATQTGRVQNRNAAGQFASGFSTVDVAATAASTGGLAKFWSGLSRVGKAAGVIGTILSVASIAITIFGNRARSAAKETEELVEADIALTDAIDDQIRTGSRAADEMLLQRIAMAGLTDEANNLAGGLANVIQIIRGLADADIAAATVESLQSAADEGDEAAASLLNYMATEHAVYRESLAASGHLTAARQDLGIATEDAADAEAELARETDETRKAQEEANDALLSYVDAMFAQRRSLMALKDAQAAYADAVSTAQDPTRATAEAENELQQARNDHAKSVRDVAEAERNLASARSDQLDELRDAQDKLRDSRDRYIDSVDRVRDAEETLAELRSGPSIDDIIDATNELADAHLRLRRAEQAVEDAEWQLAYLRGEGSSQRAIEDAELALDEARQDVANATDGVNDAERDLNEIRRGPDAREIAEAERDLERARRDSQRALREISESEEAVRDLRREIANDTAYKDAQSDLIRAHGQEYDALQKIRDAEIELQRIRAGGLQDDIAKAQLDLEQAIYDVAQANVEVKKQQALARGEYWDSGRQAQELAAELRSLADAAPNADARKRLEDYIAVLGRAKPGTQPKEEQPASSKKGGSSAQGGAADFTNLLDGVDAEEQSKKGEDIFETIFRTIASVVGGRFVGWLFAAILGAFGIAIGGWAVLLIGIIAGFLIDQLLKSELGQRIVGGIVQGMKNAVDGIGRFLHSLWFDYIWAPIKRLFGIASPSKKTAEAGVALIEGLIMGMANTLGSLATFLVQLPIKFLGWLFSTPPGQWLLEKGKQVLNGFLSGLKFIFGGGLVSFLTSVPGRVVGFFGNAINWLATAGRNVMSGLYNGIVGFYNNSFLKNFKPFSWITSFFGNAFEWLKNIGKNIISGLWNGISEKWNEMTKWIGDAASHLPGFIKGPLNIRSPSRVFMGLGENIAEGLAMGVENSLPYVDKAMQKMLDAASMPDALFYEDVMDQFDENRYRDFAAAQLGSSGGANAVTNNNGDTFNITDVEKADAIEVAEEIMFKKVVRTRG